MLFVDGSLLDPPLENVLFFFRQLLVKVWRRHDVILIVGNDSQPGLALLQALRKKCLIAAEIGKGTLRSIKTQIRFSLLFIEAVTGKARIRENLTHIHIECHLVRASRQNRKGCEKRGKQPDANSMNHTTSYGFPRDVGKVTIA